LGLRREPVVGRNDPPRRGLPKPQRATSMPQDAEHREQDAGQPCALMCDRARTSRTRGCTPHQWTVRFSVFRRSSVRRA